jgi:hypothetical protein
MFLAVRIKSVDQRTGCPTRAPSCAKRCGADAHEENAAGRSGDPAVSLLSTPAIIGVRAEIPRCIEEKTNKLDVVPVAGTNRLLLQIRSETSRAITPPPYAK